MHKKILFLSIPLVISNITVPLFGIVNTALIGHLNNSDYLAAVALGVAIVNLICFLFTFFRMSMTGLIAQSLGKRNFELIAELLIRAIIVALSLALVILIFKSLIYKVAISIINTDDSVLLLLKEFYNIAIYSVVFALLNYVLLGFFIGIQKTKIVFVSSLLSTMLGILLSCFFINILAMGLKGIAYSMLISQGLLLLILLISAICFLKSKSIGLILIFSKFEFLNIESYLPFLKVNSNIFIRSFCLLVSFNSFYIFSSYYGKNTLAANAILVEIAVFIAMILDALANTTETLIGESYIRQDREKLKEIIVKTLVQCMVISIIFSISYTIFSNVIINMFTSIPAVISEINKYIIFSILLPIFAAFSFWIDGVFVGMLKTRAMRNAMIISMFFYMILVYIFSFLGNYGLWLAMLGFYIIRTISLAIPLKRYLK
ncbi:MATE family efflux transporter [Pseudofrancisella aestuarii]|uniref:MATE family efflux transporter n=1 Tax=Pseudofrancisella aestuarii TaxID=2670347 RepID=A0ABV9TAJ4_9GAMM|nr:MATE family efflux transporter [Pseudofrancisella aestuarii]